MLHIMLPAAHASIVCYFAMYFHPTFYFVIHMYDMHACNLSDLYIADHLSCTSLLHSLCPTSQCIINA